MHCLHFWEINRMCCNNAYHSGHLFQRTVRFCEQLATTIPNAHVYYRRGLALKRIIPQCVSRDFTYLIVINEDRKVPSILIWEIYLIWFFSTGFPLSLSRSSDVPTVVAYLWLYFIMCCGVDYIHVKGECCYLMFFFWRSMAYFFDETNWKQYLILFDVC